MENLYDKFQSMEKYKLQSEQVIIENNIKLEGAETVSKVLVVNCESEVDMPIEALSSECMLSGKLITNVIFVTTEGELNNQTSVSPFSYKLVNENITNGTKINVIPSVVNTELDKLINNEIKVLTTVNLDVTLLKNNEINYLKDCEDGCYIKQHEHDVVTHNGYICEKVKENLDATIKDGVKKILMTNVDFILKDWTLGPNFVTVEGEVYAKVLYADKQEISELQTLTITKAFKQEIELSGVTKDMDLDLLTFVLNEDLGVEILEKEEGCTINIDVPLMVCINTYSTSKLLTISDMYSCKDEIQLKNKRVENHKCLKPEWIEGKIEGNVALSDDMPRVDKLIGLNNVRGITSNVYISNNKLVLEGVALANIIYLNDEANEIQSVEIEIPYVLDKKVELEQDTIIEASLHIIDADVMVKRGREIYFDAKVKAFVNLTCKQTINLVAEVEKIDAIPEKDGAIEIYFGKSGESLWDIAKTLRISREIISGQNPELNDPLDKDQNIAVYYQKQRKQ